MIRIFCRPFMAAFFSVSGATAQPCFQSQLLNSFIVAKFKTLNTISSTFSILISILALHKLRYKRCAGKWETSSHKSTLTGQDSKTHAPENAKHNHQHHHQWAATNCHFPHLYWNQPTKVSKHTTRAGKNIGNLVVLTSAQWTSIFQFSPQFYLPTRNCVCNV